MPHPDAPPPPAPPAPWSLRGLSGPRGLEGRRVLVVEDDWLLADELRAALERAGARVLGPAAGVADALALVAAPPPPDLAVLDINLGGEMAFPVADALRARAIPFVFATGYDAWAVPDAYADVPRAEKPIDLARLLGAPP